MFLRQVSRESSYRVDARHCIALVIMAIVSHTSLANDGFGQLGLGGVVAYEKSDSVSMRKEVLEISASQVRVSYEFVNESDRDLTLPVVFPLPTYSAILPSMSWAGQPAGFKLVVDGVERPFTTHVRAIKTFPSDSKEDVTEKLLALGLTREQVALLPGVLPSEEVSPFRDELGQRVKPVSKVQRQDLRNAGLLMEGPSGETDYPAWEVSIVYSWQMSFPAGKPVSVAHSYKPFRAMGVPAAGNKWSFDELKQKYCANERMIERLRQGLEDLPNTRPEYLRNGPYGTAGTVVDYILTTANTWKGPIREFTLRLKKVAPGEFISLCFPGKFKKIDANTVEVHLQDFVPDSELSVRFVNPTLWYGEDAAFAYSGGLMFEAPRVSKAGAGIR